MKIRNGFVSNSSSASFIVHWRVKTMGKKMTLREALSILYDIHSYNPETDEINWDKNWTKDYKETCEYILRHTIQNYDGSFTTSFGTNMLNSYDDLGNAAKSIVLGLVADYNFEIIDTKLDCNN